MTQDRHNSAGDGEGRTDGAAPVVRPKRMGRRVLTRFLPGSVALLAAFTMPELSVGAGDRVENSGFDDPPEPAGKPGPGLVKTGLAPVKPQLAGVRYAPILDLDLTEPATLALPAVMPSMPAGNRPEWDAVAAESTPLGEADTPAFVPTPPPTSPIVTPVTGGAEEMAEVLAPASMPAAPVAAAAVVAEAMPVIAPAALPAIDEAPSLPRTETARAALPAPATPAPVAAAPAPPPALVAAAPAPPVGQAMPAMTAARGMIEQVTPARIAAAQTPKPSAVSPAMGAPAARPPMAAAAAAPVAASVAVASPAARAPVSASVPAARPAAVPAAPPPVTPAASSAPTPAKTAAIVVPRPSSPALAAPPASKPAIPEVTAQLITRVDGKTAGAVDFQQTPAGLKVRVGSIVEVLADRYDPAQLARIRGSAAGNQYLSLAELQAQGVPISYDPVYDEFNVGLTDTRPKAARKVHMDQISTPERGLGATGMAQVPRPR